MDLLFLGTAAAEGYPGLFCRCENCQEARQLGGRNLRLRSAVLVNKDLLLDCGPDLVASALRYNLDLPAVQTLLVTHSHGDHFYLSNLDIRGKGFRRTKLPNLNVYGPAQAIGSAIGLAKDKQFQLSVQEIAPFETWTSGAYEFTALPAQHGGPNFQAFLYLISDGRHRILYATDTGPLPEESWTFLQKLGPGALSAVILDENSGPNTLLPGWWPRGNHMTLPQFFHTKDRFEKTGLLAPGALFIAHHFSHNRNPTYEKLAPLLEPKGVMVAYDGLQLSLASSGARVANAHQV